MFCPPLTCCCWNHSSPQAVRLSVQHSHFTDPKQQQLNATVREILECVCRAVGFFVHLNCVLGFAQTPADHLALGGGDSKEGTWWTDQSAPIAARHHSPPLAVTGNLVYSDFIGLGSSSLISNIHYHVMCGDNKVSITQGGGVVGRGGCMFRQTKQGETWTLNTTKWIQWRPLRSWLALVFIHNSCCFISPKEMNCGRYERRSFPMRFQMWS